MTRNHDMVSERQLARRLKREAEGAEPSYSPALHARIMARVGRAAAKPSPGQRRTLPWIWLAVTAAAAAMTVALWTWERPGGGPGGGGARRGEHGPIASDTTPSLAGLSDLLEKTAGPARASLERARYAYLDRDARRLAEFMMDQLSVPSAGR